MSWSYNYFVTILNFQFDMYLKFKTIKYIVDLCCFEYRTVTKCYIYDIYKSKNAKKKRGTKYILIGLSIPLHLIVLLSLLFDKMHSY